MLADALNGAREQVVDELENLGFNGSDLSSGRRQRLEGLLEDLVKALRYGGVDEEPLLSESTADPAAIEHDERELMRRYVIGKIENHQLEASASETALVSEWAHNAEQYRMREENRRLRALLDEVDESTAILAPDGRFLYVNRHEAQFLRRAYGIPPDKIVGSSAEELAVPAELCLTQSHNGVLSLARAKCKVERVALGRAFENQFDAVYAPYVMNVVPDPVTVMREMLRVCRPSGRLVLLNHFRRRSEKRIGLESLLGLVASKAGVNWDIDLQALLRAAGLTAQSVDRVNVPRVSSVVVCQKTANQTMSL